MSRKERKTADYAGLRAIPTQKGEVKLGKLEIEHFATPHAPD